MEAEEYKKFAVESFNDIEKFTRAFINNNSIKIVNDDKLTDINKHTYSVNYILNQFAIKAGNYAVTFAL